jgi:pilus assembly protein CpaC
MTNEPSAGERSLPVTIEGQHPRRERNHVVAPDRRGPDSRVAQSFIRVYGHNARKSRMLKPLFAAARSPVLASLALASCLWTLAGPTLAQTTTHPVTFHVSGSTQRLEMTVNTSRILTLEHSVPRMLVNNTDVVRATPLSPNQVQISALRAGGTQVNFWDENERVYTVDVVVMADVGDLERVLAAEFPEASLQLRPTNTSVIITGYVPSAEMVGSIVRIAEDYYPRVINRITVGGVQQVMLKVKVMEVSRTKLRRLGIDWTYANGNDFIQQVASGIQAASSPAEGAATIRLGIVNNASDFNAYINALQRNDLVKLMAEPTLVTTSGRPASFNSGGEFPILVPQSLGTVTVQFREFGTRIDFVPIVLGNGTIRLEVRPQVSELDPTRSVNVQGTNIPGLRNRWIDTAVEMRAGQTMALGGLLQTRVEAHNQGIPLLADMPWVGAAFRSVKEQYNEVELLVMVTPEFVDAMDPEEVPQLGPGEATESPCNKDLYIRGYLEVPRGYGISCDGNNCRHGKCGNPNCQPGQLPEGQRLNFGPAPETIDPGIRQPQTYHSSPPARNVSTARRTNPHLPQNQSSRRTSTAGGQPELIGPIGYDVLK